MGLRRHVPLAPYTTFGVGGPAAELLEVYDDTTFVEALRAADARGQPVLILGGGANVLVADAGFDGLVLVVRTAGRRLQGEVLEVAAGEDWDPLVAWTVAQGLAGIECLSGIPGRAGAAPIQNIGAYGQEVAETVLAVRAWDRWEHELADLTPADCAFGYRSSHFKAVPERFAVLSLRLGLRLGLPAPPRYGELSRALEALAEPGLADVRAAVLALRRGKGMVYDPADPLTHGAGSFFVNPTVTMVTGRRLMAAHPDLPAFDQPDGRVKLAAAWLIEHAGFPRGSRLGRAGLSPRHALALLNTGGATAAEVRALAAAIQAAVQAAFGVRLEPEPRFVGF
ncbi:MAG: UDP-N-acetylmuramate dehydrogenase [Pseudomonadota bacterium]